MDGNGIVQIIQSLGFPIACVIAMFAMWQKEVHSHDEEMEKSGLWVQRHFTESVSE